MLADQGCGWNRRGGTAPLVVGLALLGLGCNVPPSAGSCQTQTCANGAAGTYQACEKVNGNVDYNLAGQMCTCFPGKDNQNQCLFCAQIVAGYCGSIPTIGVNGAAGASNCVATFSGGFTGMAPSCAVTIMYAPSAGLSSVTVKGSRIPGTPFGWGADLVLDGVPAAGMFDQAQGMTANAWLSGDTGVTPSWGADINAGSSTGDAALEIADTGPGVHVDGQTFYESAHGTWTGRLVDMSSQSPQPDVALTVTF